MQRVIIPGTWIPAFAGMTVGVPAQATHLFPEPHKQVHVVGHQTVRVHLDTEFHLELGKRIQIPQIIPRLRK